MDDEEIDATDPSRLSSTIPKYLRVRIADAVMAFAQVEHAMADAIWSYLQLSRHEGRIFLNNIGFQQKRALARRLFREHHDVSEFDRATNAIWPMLKRVADDRNMLVHGRLFMLDRVRLISVSDRPHVSEDLSECRVFPAAKLEQLVTISNHLRNLLENLAKMYARPGRYPLHPITDRSEAGLVLAVRTMLKG